MKLNLSNWKLYHAGLALVMVPLIFQISLFVVLLDLLNQAEAERRQEIHAKNVLMLVTNASRRLNAITGNILLYALTSQYYDDEANTRHDKFVEDEKRIIKEMRSITSDNDEEAILITRTANLFENVFNLVESFRGKEGPYLVQVAPKAKRLAGEFDVCVNQLVALEYRSQSKIKARLELMSSLYIGIGLTISVAVILALFFAKLVASRLSTISDNSTRLALGEELNPVLTGSDEIARLDQTFHRMAQSISDAQRKERALTENASDIICTIDEDGTITSINPAAEKLWAYEPELLIGKHYSFVVQPHEGEEEVPFITEGVYETKVLKGNGVIGEMRWSTQWSHEEKSMFCVVHDVTEHNEAERFKQQLLNMVSHDIRSPITTILASLNFLSDGPIKAMPEEAKSIARTAEDSAKRLLKLTNDLLDLERTQAGKLRLEIDDVDIKSVFANAYADVTALMEKHQVSIDLPDTDLMIQGDNQRLTQVMTNLLSNAIKFSPPGSSIRVEIEKFDDHVAFKVVDRGRGIAQGDMDKLFKSFQQILISDATVEKGSGLGLSICKAIVDAHGGEIGVDSEVGQGSVFWFRIPLGLEEED